MCTKRLMLAVLAVGLVVPAAFADFTPFVFSYEGNDYEAVTRVKMTTTSGGSPYVATVIENAIPGHAVGTSFDTFCLEQHITFNPGHTYYASIDTVSAEGLTKPGNSYGTVDPLGDETAWIYSQWLDGNLSASGADVQKAVWYWEGEGGVNNSVAQAAAAHSGEGLGLVRVLNLWTITSNSSGGYNVIDRQSQLVRLPSDPVVPAPGAAILGLLGFGSVSVIRRRSA